MCGKPPRLLPNAYEAAVGIDMADRTGVIRRGIAIRMRIRIQAISVAVRVVSTGYVCFVRNETEYCLKGTTDGSAFSTNTEVLEDAFKDAENACSFDGDISDCSADGLEAYAGSDGYVRAYNGDTLCDVYSDGLFGCRE